MVYPPLQQDIRTFLRKVKEKQQLSSQKFTQPGALANFLGRKFKPVPENEEAFPEKVVPFTSPQPANLTQEIKKRQARIAGGRQKVNSAQEARRIRAQLKAAYNRQKI